MKALILEKGGKIFDVGKIFSEFGIDIDFNYKNEKYDFVFVNYKGNSSIILVEMVKQKNPDCITIGYNEFISEKINCKLKKEMLFHFDVVVSNNLREKLKILLNKKAVEK